jgi:Zn-dependent protease
MLFAGFGFQVVYLLIALLIGLTFHEASHALVANALGDPTPKKAGRLSLNPLAHLDPYGSLMILLVGLGWGKPVQIDAEKLRPGPKIGMALVAIAGPISNILLAAVFAIPLRLHLVSLLPQKIFEFNFGELGYHAFYFSVGQLVLFIVWLSLALAIFNLIPLTPLDGSRLWQIVLPTKWYYQFARVEYIGLFLVLGLILSDRFFGTNILARILFPPIGFLWQMLVGMSPPFQF